MRTPSRRRLFVLLCPLLCWSCASVAPAPPAKEEPATIFLVRHAEKASEANDAPLSETGRERARTLARVLGEAGIETIYTTEYVRNIETAKPLADALRITPAVIPAADLDALAARLRAIPPGGAALVVSHTDRLPLIGQKLGVRIPEVAHTEFDRLTIVTLSKESASARILRYGAPSAPR
ncbi:MAG: histidine phosphatase family protein [Bryobacterales bacterium]|nr:histidine phosphatase family protein [Bryobacterales bacterium]